MSMGNIMRVGSVASFVMATARHPTVDADGDPETSHDEDRDRSSSEQPPIGIDHRTVVPTNLERRD